MIETRNDMLPDFDPPESGEAIDRYRAPALDKGLDILELLAGQKEGLTRTEISKKLGRSAGEIFRMLERLVTRRYVVRSTGGDRYTLSLKLFALAHQHPPTNRLIAEAMPQMQRFADAVEQSCHLSVYDRGTLLVIAQVDGPGTWGISVRAGSRISLVDTASGRVMLSFQGPDHRAQMLADYRQIKGEAPLNEKELAYTFESIRQSGYLRQDSRQAYGMTDLSVPILGLSGQAIAVLTCPYMRRIDGHVPPSLHAAIERLRNTGELLSIL
ncbi:IclR family transcriptional regulator [Burkholderia cepacia]|uniref:IclR family transcriptional regulator n=1 Tax=Burkholderia cepacia TaxID=292 RepID=UPI0007575867|nr:IclR family transcriptional regulator [Burkholderia cepacia]KWC91611.1 IclR family transcriptional regulator [Burkholderia cepacia]